jgi:hypothetical protein
VRRWTKRISRWLPSAQRRRRWKRAFVRAPRTVRVSVVVVALLCTWVLVNGCVQLVKKPTELFFPMSGTLAKTPTQTWEAYGSSFRHHATDVIRADLLAAIAQVEGSGDPVARPAWRWAWRASPFEIYRPASSAVGMFQITDGTFALARRYCIRDHHVVEEGPWYDFRSCWLNELYTRTLPSHAVELTAAYLDRGVAQVLQRHPVPSATLRQRQTLAAMMHLCGAGAAAQFARRGLTFVAGQRCGSHDARSYVGRVTSMQRQFAALAAAD